MKKLLFLALTVLMLSALSFKAFAAWSGDCGDNATWQLNDDGLLTIEGEGEVTSHGWSSCSGRDTIRSIVISEGVTSLCDYAFDEMTSIKSVVLPDSLESIGKRAFHYCFNMESVRMSTGLTVLGEGAFYQCESLAEINLPQGLMAIPDNAFVYCRKLTRVGIPDSVQSIGEYAFYGCSALEEARVPEGVTEIKISTFDQCESLRRVDLPSTLKLIEQSAFDSCTSLVQIDLPDSVNYINGLAFARCTSMKSFTFPSDLTTVNWQLFEGSGLESVVLPKTITSIDELAFSQCANLGEVTVYSLRANFASSDIFEDSPNVRLKGYERSSAQTYAAAHGIPFESMGEAPYEVVKSGTCGKNLSWTLGDDDILRVTGSGAMTDYSFKSPWADEAVIAILPEGLTHIGNYAFYYPYMNVALQSVNIPSTVKSIGSNAFGTCRNLAEIDIPMGVEEIGYSAFYRAYKLKEVDLPESVAVIGDNAFEDCLQLKRVTIYNRDAQIGSNAFAGCDEDLTLYGHSGSTAQAYAEANNIPFEVLPAEWSAPVYTWSNFDSVTATRYYDDDMTLFETETVSVSRALKVPPTETTAGEVLYTSAAFKNPAFKIQTAVGSIPALREMDVLYLPDDLHTIEASAFENLSCQAVIVPRGCVEIGERAFAGSDTLLYVRLPQNAVVALDAFDGCDVLLDCFE